MIKNTDRLCFLGDSITYGVSTTKRYLDYIAEATGAEVHGYGVDGAQSDRLLSQLDRLDNDVKEEFDILFILIGTNDFYGGVPLGNFFTETKEKVPVEYDSENRPVKYAERKKREFVFDDSTFSGRLNKALGFIKEKYPTKRVILLTPLHRAYAYFGGGNVQQNELYANSAGEFFETYVETIRRAADIWSVELIDLYRESGLFPLSEKHAELFFNKDKEDSLHPNASGHKKMAEVILRKA